MIGLTIECRHSRAMLAFGVSPLPASSPVPGPSATAAPTTATIAHSTLTIDPPTLLHFVIALLIFAVITLVILFVYTYAVQSRFYDVFERLGQSGHAPRVVSSDAFANAAGLESLESAEAAPPPTLHIEGPAIVTVGVMSAEFTATLDVTPAGMAAWRVDPAQAAAVNPGVASKVRVVPAMSGGFTLSATVADAQASVQVAAVAPQPEAGELPFIGRGYGSLVIAVVLIVAVMILALAGILGGDAVSTLFGGLLGYIFGTVTSTSSARKSSNVQGQHD
jgi:hypothetical protein